MRVRAVRVCGTHASTAHDWPWLLGLSLWSVSDFLDIPSKEAASSDTRDRQWGYGKGEVWADENAEWQECSRQVEMNDTRNCAASVLPPH